MQDYIKHISIYEMRVPEGKEKGREKHICGEITAKIFPNLMKKS